VAARVVSKEAAGSPRAQHQAPQGENPQIVCVGGRGRAPPVPCWPSGILGHYGGGDIFYYNIIIISAPTESRGTDSYIFDHLLKLKHFIYLFSFSFDL
jgi:hypothetical protein